ncbi:MAG: hypothetical protein EAY75_13270 [Bacteroidetes bacterium]|nr:MAG: hypothetical protein EAY75_13270 [Bacteroidota bacterium]
MSEGSVVYQITVQTKKAETSLADAFDGARQTVWFKGSDVRIDFGSLMLKQITLFDDATASAVVLKEVGKEKYMMMLNAAQWQHYNRKYDGLSYTYGNEEKTIAGYVCKQVTATLKDGSTMSIFYTPDVQPLTRQYDYAFRNLPGLALMYEVNTSGITLNYTATSVSFLAVNGANFDLPKSGYKILTYKP